MSTSENVVHSVSTRQTEIQSRLRDILARLFSIEPSTVETQLTFFEMGADSLFLLQASQTIRDELGVAVPFRMLFEECSTIESLAAYIDRELPAEETVVNSNQQVSTEQAVALADTPSLETQASPSSREATRHPHVSPQTVPATALPPAGTANPISPCEQGSLAHLVEQQLQVMSQQLALLSNVSVISNNEKPLSKHEPTTPIPQPVEHPTYTALPVPTKQGAQTLSQQLDPEIYVPYKQGNKAAVRGLTTQQQQHLDTLIERINRKTQASKQRAQQFRTPLADNRASSGFNQTLKEVIYPITCERAQGSHIWDIDGNEYVDITMGFGALLFGHSPSFILEAMQEQLNRGFQLGLQSNVAGEVAQLLTQMTQTERATFVNSGTEAVMTAVRLARAVTGRNKIALFAGSFHGTFDGLLARAQVDANGLTRTVPLAPGITPHTIEDVIILEFGAPESYDILAKHAHELAAVLMEMPQSRRPDVVPIAFIQQVRELADTQKFALIFDEVVTGFRSHPGGAQAVIGVQPDLVTYGKAAAAGLPIGVVAGKARYMDAIDGGIWQFGDQSYPQATQTFFAGTYFKHPLIMPGVYAVLKHLQECGPQLQEELTRRTEIFVAEMNAFFEQVNIPIALIHFGSLCRFVFAPEYKRIDASVFFYHLLDKGVYFPEGRSCFLSTAHSEEDVAYVIAAMKQSIYEMMAAGFFGGSTPPPQPSGKQEDDKKTVSPPFPQLVELSTARPEEEWRNHITAPITEEQKELWTLAQMGDHVSRAYNEMLALQLSGPLQKDSLYQSLQKVIARHEALRTTFSPEGDQQYIAASLKLQVHEVAFTQHTQESYAQHLYDWMQQEVQRPFDLANGPLIRFHLLTKTEQEHVLILTIHHSIADGWSMGLLLREISALYSATVQNETCTLPKVMQYREYAQWQEEQQHGQALKKAEEYWKQQFPTELPALNLPTDHPRPLVKAYQGARTRFLFEQQLSQKVRQMSGKLNSSLFALLLSTFEVWLQRITGQDQIVVGVPMAGQLAIDDGNFVGHAVNLALIQSRFSQTQTFKQHLTSTKKTLLDASKHQIYPFRQLVKRLNPLRVANRLAVISVAFNVDHDGQTNFSGLHTELLSTPLSAAKYDLFLNCTETAAGLQIDCDYDPELFEVSTIQHWLQSWATLISEMLTDPARPLSQASAWSPTQWQLLQESWNQTTTSYPKHKGIHQLFEEQALLHPHAPALLFDGEALSYNELNQRANKLAHYLRKSEVGPEVCVGLCMERSFEMIVATLAILKAGGTYVPLDPSYPHDRLTFMAHDAGISIVLTQEHLQERLLACVDTLLCVDNLATTLLFESGDNLETHIEVAQLAYIMYTSGSTGWPKGVAVTHQNVVRLVKETNYAHFGPDEVLLQFAPTSFDAATFEIWGALLNGAQLAIYQPGIPALDELGAFLEHHQVTTLWLTSGLFQQMVEQQLSSFSSVRQLLAGGDVLALPQVRKVLAELPNCTLINGYGPTENTTFTTCHRMKPGIQLERSVPIGVPIANTRVYLLDQWLQPVPVGVYGELFIAGDGLARGYINQPGLTAEKFIPHPWSTIGGERLYRTGDLARYLPNGEIEFLGRKDNQVKIRGFRIEPGEIEAVLSKQPYVQDSIVTIREDVPGSKHIAAYIIFTPDTSIPINQVRSELKELLPSYMIPHSFTRLAQFPLNANGKVDRQALPAPQGNEGDIKDEHGDALSPVEKKLAEIWSQLLGVAHVGRDENFFELGGDSIIAIRILARAKEEGIHLSSKQMFQYQTIAELAAVATTTQHREVEQQLAATPIVPLTPIQHWFLDQKQSNPHHFNMSVMLEAPADLRLDLLREVLQYLVMRHDALRIRLPEEIQNASHFILAESEQANVHYHDLSQLTEAEQIKSITEDAEKLQKQVNLNQGPLLQAAFFSRGTPKSARVLLVVHHIGIDIVSWQLLLDELNTCYELLIQGKELYLPNTSTPFAHWSQRLTDYAQSEALQAEHSYWMAAERASIETLPLDHVEGANREECAAHAHIELSLEETQALQHLIQRTYQTQFSDALIAGLAAALTRWTGSSSVIIDREGHGRENLFDDVDLSRTVGWFTSIAPILIHIEQRQQMPDILQSVKKQLKQIPHGGIGYGILRYLSQDQSIVTQLQHQPQAQVSFNYIGRSAQSQPQAKFFSITGGERGQERSPAGTRKYLLDINAMIADGKLRIDCMYSQDIHQAITIEALLNGIVRALQELLQQPATVEKRNAPVSDLSLSGIKQEDLNNLFSNVKFG
ncbi:non-ribosomal peptide synthetase [Dictyobacter kobayashii]|uniref:Carrier domain-containing protein n=1 Tax=Dictyobacter kobayashii TaxID=2014872 RepID=A0A402AVI2_9CHLR|nr:non-ribosomal peptide synthetase [Dictyobacter kobayashii]GCE23094.1 hypothetical protein KDK_68940 [Dictyobacter kobayashii]